MAFIEPMHRDKPNITYLLTTNLGNMLQWNLSVTTTSIKEFITCDLFNNVF